MTENVRMRVCHVVEATSAGTRRHVIDLLANLPLVRVASTLIYSPLRADSMWFREMERLRDRIEIIELPMVRTIHPWRDLRSIAALARLFRQRGFDIIHVHSGKAGLLGRLAAALAGMPSRVVYTPNASPYRLHWAYGIVERRIAPLADRIIAVSDSERQELIQYAGGKPGQVVTVASGIDTEDFSSLNSAAGRALPLPAGTVRIGSVGRIAPQKAPLDFVRMAAIVAQTVPESHFVWIGEGELRYAMERLIAENGLIDQFTLTGFMEDVRPGLAQLDVFCLLSNYESFGYVTVEAMALSLPVVGTDVPGTRDVLSPGSGLLVPTGRPDEAARRVIELCRDAPLRARLGRAGQKRAATEFSAQRMGADTLRVYEELVGRATAEAFEECT